LSRTYLSKHIPDLTYMTMIAESRNSWLHDSSPWTKLIVMFLGIIMIIIIKNILILFCIYLIVLIIFISARLPIIKLKDWYFLPIIITLSIILPLIFNQPGASYLFFINFGPYEIYLTDIGLNSLLTLLLRALTSVTISFTFIMTTKYKEIVYIIHKIFPPTMADILLLSYRYIFLTMDEIGGRINALKVRGGNLLSYFKNLKNFGTLIALSIINGIERGTRLIKAIELRGGESEIIYVNEKVKKPGLPGILIIILLLIIIITSIIYGFESLFIYLFNLISTINL
jgi:cobalt/nickel transport system permease protein